MRVYLIDKNSFWEDETVTAAAVKNHGTLEIFRNALFNGNVTPEYFPGVVIDLPFYFVLLSLWSKLFGISELSLRLLSALSGSFSVFMVFLVAKQLANRKVALLSSFIFSLSMVHIQFSQEARHYSLLTAIALLSAYFFIRYFKEGKILDLAILAVLTVVGLYTHFPYVFFVAFQGIYTLAMAKLGHKHVKGILIVLLFAGLIYLPLLPRIMGQEASTETYVTKFIGQPGIISIAKVWFLLNTWIYPSPELMHDIRAFNFFGFAVHDWLLIISAFLLVFLMTIFFAMGILSYKPGKSRKTGYLRKEWFLMLLIWFFAPILLQLLLTILRPAAKIFGPISYLLFIFPAYIILVSIGILSLKRKHSAIAVILVVLFSILPLASYYTNVNKQQWREVSVFMKENLAPGEAILLNSPYMEVAFDYYYGDYSGLYPVHNATQAGEASKNRNSLWLILSFDRYFDPQGEIRSYLEKEYELEREEDFFDIKVLHYSRRSSKT